MDTIFPYAFRQGALRADFRVSSGRCEIRDFTPNRGGRSRDRDRPGGSDGGSTPGDNDSPGRQ
jgi:hypothetical protein